MKAKHAIKVSMRGNLYRTERIYLPARAQAFTLSAQVSLDGTEMSGFPLLVKWHGSRRPPPQEVIDEIVGWVDSPRDLFNLALANRILKETIIPAHLEYRSIRARIDDGYAFWKAASSNKALAQKIGKLEIQATRRSFTWATPLPPRLPAAFPLGVWQPEDQSEERTATDSLQEICKLEGLFIAALKNMVNLTTFCWSRSSLVGNWANELWSILKECPNLKELRAADSPSADLYSVMVPTSLIPRKGSIWGSTVCLLFLPQYLSPYSTLSVRSDFRSIWSYSFQS
jgi:hypothetical protein